MPHQPSPVKTTMGIALVAAVTASTPVIAQEDRYIDIMPFITRVDDDRNTERQGGGLRGTFGWQTDDNWFTEVQLFGALLDERDNRFDEDPLPVNSPYIYTGELIPSGDLELSGLGVDVVYSFAGRDGYSPFILGGVGASHNNTKYNYGLQETNAFINVGVGFTSGAISDNGLKVRAEVRYMRDFFAGDMNDWQFGIGLSIPLSCPPVAAPVAAPPPPEPEPQVVNLDDDDDGVLNQNDRCPNTLPGAQVDQYGCVVADQTITLENIQFEFNSAKLTVPAQRSLDLVVQSLRSQPNTMVEVAGHTDSQGNDSYNLRLSGQRAESVRRYLVENGVNTTRISARGYGETQPVASNATEAGRAQNRRVELNFR
ncbi:OmpA family protein [Microbulbifer bruguierae]|uniref:OmpA family protein n=1 Tax=Microbulbifer bruguierae TaxID=3029061 RepID=A0ABY8NFQ2_9GAMM|nr:OmpA family protein [Microbulbifer bruguierae]WGL17751.1 OmpA family protein [Microbulbifer bruguierae]